MYTDRQSSNVIYHLYVTRAQEHKSTRAQEHKSTRAQEHKSTKAQESWNPDEILRNNLEIVRTAAEWAEKCGYMCTKQFAQHYRKKFSIKCKEAMIRIRLQQAINLIKTKPDLKFYEVARRVGLPDEFSLYKYFMRHSGTAPSNIRKNGQD